MELIGSGRMWYGNNWAYLSIDDDIVRYYQWFIKRRYPGGLRLHIPKAGPHITVVRGEERDPIEAELKEQFWKKWEGKEFEFRFDPSKLVFNGEYFWFNVDCPGLEQIRTELGLTPKPFYDYHLTIAKLYPEDVETFHTFLRISEEYEFRGNKMQDD